MNRRSIGICLVGGVERTDKKKENGWTGTRPCDNFNKKQFAALSELLKQLEADFKPRRLRIIGHRNVPNVLKDCPSFDVTKWLGKAYPI